MMSFEEALGRVLAEVLPLPAVQVSVAGSRGRILQEAVLAQVDLPTFDNSAMDGYAVRAEDLAGASREHPVALKCGRSLPAGTASDLQIGPGECCRIFTGSMIPSGADAVVMQEDVQVRGEEVVFFEAARPLENLRLRGEDIKRGDLLGRAGEAITPAMMAIFSAAGKGEVQVAARPRVTILATGDELVEPGASLTPGKIYESNRGLLAALAEETGAEVRIGPIVSDSPGAIEQALSEAFSKSDVVVSSGGVSVGEHDYIKDAFEKIGGKWNFWKVSIKPGKPFVFGSLGSARFFALPGNPISAGVAFLLLVRPALLKMQGSVTLSLPALEGVLQEDLINHADRRHFMRVIYRSGTIRSAGPQGSHLFRSFVEANALVDVPPKTRWEKGKIVSALIYGGAAS